MKRGYDKLARVALVCAAGFLAHHAQGQFSETILHSFNGGDGIGLTGELLPGRDGSYYGTTFRGGTNDAGTVFKITADGALTTLYFFTGGNDGLRPWGLLVQGSDGALCGSTSLGPGPSFGATVFKLNTDGTGFTVLHTFSGGDGQNCDGLVLGSYGEFYGTTGSGGSHGIGTVFRLNADGSGYTLIYNLDGNPSYPYTALAQGLDGGLYGEEELGGSFGYGTLDRLNTNGADYTVLYNFGANTQEGVGPNPQSGLAQGNDGALYGTTSGGGSNLYGTVFRLNTNGTGYAVLHSFGQTPTDGVYCEGRLAQGRDGAWYGTTDRGGTYNAGTVFRVNSDGTGYAVLYNFATNGGAKLPYAGLVQSADGAWYGTADGGSYGLGTVFRLAPASPQFTGFALLPNNTFQLSLTGASNSSYRIDASTDLVNWAALTNVFNASGTAQFIDRSAANYQQRFYRAAWAP